MELDPDRWVKCGILMVPFLPNQYASIPSSVVHPLRQQFSLIIDTAIQQRYEKVIVPMGRWARTNNNPLDVALRLTQALEKIPTPNFPDFKFNVIVSSPPEQAHWQHNINSVIASAKARRNEQRPPQTSPQTSPQHLSPRSTTQPSTPPQSQPQSQPQPQRQQPQPQQQQQALASPQPLHPIAARPRLPSVVNAEAGGRRDAFRRFRTHHKRSSHHRSTN